MPGPDTEASGRRLTVRSAPGAENNKICFIDIEPAVPLAISTIVTLSALSPATAEGSGSPAVIRLSREENLVDAVTVRLATSGTASAGADFPALPAVAVIPPGSAHFDLPVSAVADALA